MLNHKCDAFGIMVTDPVPVGQTRFSDRVKARARAQNSWLCVGLDPDVAHLPPHFSSDAQGICAFCKEIVQATSHHAAAFKINFAFFEQFGPEGFAALLDLRQSIPSGIPVIADAKRGDVANTARAYARALFDTFGFHAATVSPYLGWDALEPFMEYRASGILVLCKTSNPGSGALQDLRVGDAPLYIHVARQAITLSDRADIGLVVGATHPEALEKVRKLSGETLLLIPGVGAQGAGMESAVRRGGNRDGDNALIAVSRGVTGASPGTNFVESAAFAAEKLAALSWQGRQA